MSSPPAAASTSPSSGRYSCCSRARWPSGRRPVAGCRGAGGAGAQRDRCSHRRRRVRPPTCRALSGRGGAGARTRERRVRSWRRVPAGRSRCAHGGRTGSSAGVRWARSAAGVWGAGRGTGALSRSAGAVRLRNPVRAAAVPRPGPTLRPACRAALPRPTGRHSRPRCAAGLRACATAGPTGHGTAACRRQRGSAGLRQLTLAAGAGRRSAQLGRPALGRDVPARSVRVTRTVAFVPAFGSFFREIFSLRRISPAGADGTTTLPITCSVVLPLRFVVISNSSLAATGSSLVTMIVWPFASLDRRALRACP